MGRSCVPDWEKGWETLPSAGLLSAVDSVQDEGYFPVSVSWAGSSNPGRKYILQGPALSLILLWPQFQGLGLPGIHVSGGVDCFPSTGGEDSRRRILFGSHVSSW